MTLLHMRGKLIAATLLIQIATIAVLVWHDQHLIEERLLRQFEQRITATTPLLSAALITPMRQRDFASAKEILMAMQQQEDFAYLVLSDAEGKPVAAAGRRLYDPLPLPSPLPAANARQPLSQYNARIVIAYAGQHYGELAFGIKLNFLQRALHEHFWQTLTIAFFGLLASALLLITISLWLTRHIKQLTQASEALADGNSLWSMVDITDLKNAIHTAEEANRAKSQFLGNMSHELRTPLNGILGMTQLLMTTSLSEEQHDYATQITISTSDLLHAINDLLDITKLESGRINLENVEFDLGTLLHDTLHPLKTQARTKGLIFAEAIDPSLPRRLRGDPYRLGQILVNLVDNAIKFTDRGKVAISLSTQTTSDGRLRLRGEIRDSGIGIAAAHLPNLFAPFHQVDASTTRRFGGSGLGLSIAKRLVEMMGGRIGVDSLEGQGSTFWFDCPCIPADTPPTPAEEQPAMFDAVTMLARLGGDHDLAQIIVTGLITDIPIRLADLITAMAHDDSVTVRREAHTLKGLADTGGNATLRQAAFDIQLLCEDGNLAGITERLPRFETLLTQAIAEWRAYLANNTEKVGAGGTAQA